MNRRFDPRTLAFLGMMTALVFASNYARIIMPIAIGGRTSFTLANIVCVLSGLLLGPIGKTLLCDKYYHKLAAGAHRGAGLRAGLRPL